ncbi:MAG: hypothetical protein LLF94_03070 [Chlamydiales bacterium]|nr:hypothetical protein [Chlamydiales bacterium]
MLFRSLILLLSLYAPLSAYQNSVNSEHFEITCSEQDKEECRALVQSCETLYPKLSEEFQTQFSERIQIQLFPDLTTFHKTIDAEDAPDWWIIQFGNPIQMISPLNPGSYHSAENVRKALLKAVVQAFIYNKFPQCNAPWWLVAGITAKRVDWPYQRVPSFLPEINELENSTYGLPGMGWCAVSLTSYIEKKYGWEAVLKLLEDYSSFEQIIGLSKEALVNQWHAFLQEP